MQITSPGRTIRSAKCTHSLHQIQQGEGGVWAIGSVPNACYINPSLWFPTKNEPSEGEFGVSSPFSDTPDMLHKFISSWSSCFVACHLHDQPCWETASWRLSRSQFMPELPKLKVQLDWFKWLCDTVTLPKPYKLENGDGRDSAKRRNTLLNQKNAGFSCRHLSHP